MSELKPCPFCGGDAAISGNGMYVYCKDCGCKSPYVTTGPRFVIAAWNRRAQPAAPADAEPSVAPEPPRSAQLMICTGCGRQSDDEPIKPQALACCPDNRYRTLRELLSEIDTLRRTHPPRAPLTEEFWLMLDTALDALKYHQEQTRPIELTRVTIAAVETFISAHGIGGK